MKSLIVNKDSIENRVGELLKKKEDEETQAGLQQMSKEKERYCKYKPTKDELNCIKYKHPHGAYWYTSGEGSY